MNWFIAKLIFLIEQEEAAASQFDEQIRLVQAGSPSEAMLKAEAIASREEQEFFNANSKKVSWRFIGIPALYDLGQLENGKELDSKTLETEDSTDYMDYVQRRYNGLKKEMASLQPVA